MPKDNIMIDLTNNRKRYKVEICHYCNSDLFPRGRIISVDDDKNGQRQPDGSYKCGYCVGEDVKKSLSLFGGGKK